MRFPPLRRCDIELFLAIPRTMKTLIRDVCARVLARLMRHFVFDPRYFELWQSNGFHVNQVHYYSPIPDTRTLSSGIFCRESEVIGLDLNETQQLSLLDEFRQRFASEYSQLPRKKPPGVPQFYFGNVSFESVDAELLYCMIRRFRPKRYIEIGSGFTTLLSASALARNRTEGFASSQIAIEPYPAPFLKENFPHPITLLEQFVQDVPLENFTALEEGDFLFIDSSHVCKIGSDVQFEFLEILPRLAPGVIVHVHDIFLPREYPFDWVKRQHRFWNEQYLLQSFLSCNKEFEVLWAGAWMHLNYPKRLAEAFSSYDPNRVQPASFWFRRRLA